MEEDALISEEDMMLEFMRITNQELEPNELTVNSFMDKMKIDKAKARYILNKYHEKGLLKARTITIASAAVNAYSPALGTWRDVVNAIKNEE